jgi:hypothetical protein
MKRTRLHLKTALGVILATGLLWATTGIAGAATLTFASMKLSDSRPGQTAVSYTFQASNVSTGTTINCIRLEFDTSADGSGSKPTGMNITSAAFSTSSNYVPTPSGWTVINDNTTGVTTLTNAGGQAPGGLASNRTVILTGITNSSTANDDFFVLFNTYASTNCSSSPVDNAMVAFILTQGQTVSVSVSPTLTFDISGRASGTSCNGATSNRTTTSTTVPLGTVTAAVNSVAAQDLTVSTNAGNGYTVFTNYTGPPAAGAETIDDHTGTNAAPTAFPAPGTEAFGYTTNDSTLGTGTPDRFTSAGGNKWAKFTATNDAEVAFNNTSVASQVTCVGYQLGISSTTVPGTYTTTVIFTATPVY